MLRSRGVAALLVLAATCACRSSRERNATTEPPVASASASRGTSANASATTVAPSASQPPKARKPLRVAVLRDGEYPSSLSQARVTPRTTKTGDGCGTQRVFDAFGTLDHEPARAKVDVLGTRVTVRVSPLKPGKTRTFRATLDESLCAFGPNRAIEVTGRVAGNSPSSSLRLTLIEVLQCASDTRIDITVGDDSATVLELRNTLPERLALHDAFHKALGKSGDIEAAVERAHGSIVVAYIVPVERDLYLAELAGSPLTLKHEAYTGLTCTEAACEASLEGVDLPSGTAVLIPKLSETGCSLRGYRARKAALATLGPDGFAEAQTLPSSDEHDPGPNYPGTSSQTRLYWVSVENEYALAVLARNEEGEAQEYKLFPFDPVTNAFRSIDAPLDDPADAGPVMMGAYFVEF